MTKEEITNYAKKYRKNQKILLVVAIIGIAIVASVLALSIVLLLLASQEIVSIIVAIGMGLLIVLDVYGGVRFTIFAVRKIKYTKDIECARNYCRLHGIVPENKKKEQ